MINLHNMDCMVAMAEMEDNAFDLAIVDPPYGIDAGNLFGGEQRKSGNGVALKSHFTKKSWDKCAPDGRYFDELFRVSKNQIVWGANYYPQFLTPSMGWIIWDKDNGTTKFSDAELAFSSFDRALRTCKFTWNGMLQGDMKNKEKRIHPTQKPVALYQWLLKNYAKQGDKILDTHFGSGSIALACHDMGFDLECYEIDEEYYNGAVKRLKKHQQQMRMF